MTADDLDDDGSETNASPAAVTQPPSTAVAAPTAITAAADPALGFEVGAFPLTISRSADVRQPRHPCLGPFITFFFTSFSPCSFTINVDAP